MNNSSAVYQKERIGLSLPELDLSQLPAKLSKKLWVGPAEFLSLTNALILAEWALWLSGGGRPALPEPSRRGPKLVYQDRETDRLETLLIALILGLLMMLVEAVAWRGLDNLFIPIAGFLLLNSLLAMTPSQLAGRLILTVALVILCLLWRNQANMQDSALLGVALIGYLSWTLADWRWFAIPLIVFLNHLRLSSGQSGQPYNIYAVISVASGGMLWLLLFQGLGRAELFYLFTLAFAAQLAMLALVALKHRSAGLPPMRLLGLSIFQGWLFLFVPFILISGVTPLIIRDSLVALLGISLAALAFYYLQPAPETYPTDLARWLRQAGCAILGSLVGLGTLL